MAIETPSPSINEFLALIPTSPKPPSIVRCVESKQGAAFFSPFEGAHITGIALLRYAPFDLIALITNDKRAIAVVAERDGFIAVEKRCRGNGNGDANLALQRDISHRRINLAASFGAGVDVTYQDNRPVTGDVIEVDPATTFANVTLKDGVEIQSIEPSWWTEDWMKVWSPNRGKINIRAKQNKMLGAITIDCGAMNILNIGDQHLERLRLGQPPLGSIPAQFQSPAQTIT